MKDDSSHEPRSVGVPPASLPSVSLGDGLSGGTPLELAAGDGCATGFTAIEPVRKTPAALLAAAALALAAFSLPAAPDAPWQNLSSKRGELPPPPGGSAQQTGAVVGDFDGDGLNDFILSFRQKPPALVWYRRTATGWDAYVIEKDFLTIEAGGAVYDIDGDGDLDVVFGGDWQSNEVWWWENPSPHFDKNTPWKRHVIKKGGQTQHHDQVFGDFLGTGKPQLAFWNQNAKTIFLAEIPDHPREAESWPLTPIFTGSAGEEGREAFKYPEGMSAYDVDADGKLDLLAGNTWFKHTGGRQFKPIRITEVGGLIFAGYFKPTKYPQIVISPGDAVGPLRWFECTGDPEKPGDWVGHDLLERNIIHGHSLQLGDLNRDGHLDIFWTVHPGQDPVKLLRAYPNRWVLMHVKDMRQGTRTGLLTGSEDTRNDVAIGSGQIDIVSTLREAVRVGVKHFFIEHESPAVLEQIPLSIRYLESLAW